MLGRDAYDPAIACPCDCSRAGNRDRCRLSAGGHVRSRHRVEYRPIRGERSKRRPLLLHTWCGAFTKCFAQAGVRNACDRRIHQCTGGKSARPGQPRRRTRTTRRRIGEARRGDREQTTRRNRNGKRIPLPAGRTRYRGRIRCRESSHGVQHDRRSSTRRRASLHRKTPASLEERSKLAFGRARPPGVPTNLTAPRSVHYHLIWLENSSSLTVFSMNLTLKELANQLGGELIGDPTLEITGAASLSEATQGDISFFTDRKFIGLLRKTRASAIFVPPAFAERITAAQIRVSNPTKAFEEVLLKFAPKPITFAPGIHPSAVIDPSVQLGERVSIQPLAVIDAGARIGDETIIGAGSYIGQETVIGSGCRIYPNVTIRERSRIGSRVIIHSGAVIGADGFGFEIANGRHHKIQQLGIVQIDDDVEIGANTTVDRARFGRTWIQQGVKIDNLVQIAHNVVIGKNSVI